MTWQPGRLGDEVWRDTELKVRDAVWFRRICVAVATVSVPLALALFAVDAHCAGDGVRDRRRAGVAVLWRGDTANR